MRIFNKFSKRNNEKEGIPLDDPSFWERFLGMKNLFINIKGENALKEATVYTCIKIRAESVSKLPLKLYKGRDEYKTHELYNILKNRPNPYMSSINFWKCIETQRGLKGNAYAYIERNSKGKIIGLYPIDSSNVQLVIDDECLLSRDTKLWYIVTVNGIKYKLYPDEILHFVGDITLNGMVGIPPIDYMRCIVENAKASQEYMNQFFKNGLTVKGIIQYIGELSQKAKNTFKKEFEEMSNGLKNAHSISMLPIGYQFQPISLSMADAQFLETCNLTKREIASIFGVKSHQLNDLERATFTNISEQQKDYYVSTLQPSLQTYEQELEYKLLSEYEIIKNDVHCEFNVDSILRSSKKERYETYRIGIQGGFLSANEARMKENLPPKEGGDQLIINGSMLPLDLAGAQYKGGGNDGNNPKEGNEGD